jgi:cytochrome bd-type quinol oxidase subunit 2
MIKNIFIVLFGLLLLALPVVLADVNFNSGLTDDQKQTFDQILAPLMKIYDFVKYASTVIGVLMFVYAGITFVTAGGEQAKKERAKQIATGVVIGLILIWVAPLVVNYLVK